MLASKGPSQHFWSNCWGKNLAMEGGAYSESPRPQLLVRLLFPPHPQHPHTPAFLLWDGGGIILILQNAQQLIKSRSPSAFKFFCM